MTTISFDEQRGIAEARAGIYRFLAQLYGGPPSEDLLNALAQPEFREHIETVFEEAAHPFLRAVDAGLDPEALRLEYDALFRVPGDHYLRPYESVYRGRYIVDGQVIDGAVWGPWAREVQRLYAEAGAEVVREAGELPDFIGVELEFMAFLCTREAEAWAAKDQELARHFLTLEREFLIEHLSQWVDELCSEMSSRTKHGFYVGLAQMTQAFLAADIQHR